MSAAVLRPVASSATQVMAVWRAMPGAYLLLGRAAGPVPKSGSARLARETAPGMFRTYFWPLGSEQAVGFVTVIRVPDRLPITDESEVILRGTRGADRDFTLRLTPVCEEEEFGRHMASLAGASAAALARFILDLIQPEQQTDVRRPVLLLESFLQHAARHEGCVELLLEIPNRVLLLQGWGPPTGSDVEIVLTGASVTRRAAQIGEFSRNDIQPPLTGSVLALPVDVVAELSNASSIFLLTPDEILCRRVLDSRVLDPTSSTGQIRHLLPRLICPPALTTSLQQALQPQYEGVDTVNTSERRVRAALDIAVAGEGAGIFLSGWLLDPASQIISVECCAGIEAVRIDPDFVRIQREDVLLAFAGDASMLRPPTSEIGFAASIAANSFERPHLRFTCSDGDVLFLPIVLRNAAEPGIRTQLCTSIDMHKTSGIEIVMRHLAPFLSKAVPPSLSETRTMLRGPLHRPHAVVVPLASPALPRAVIAGLLNEPLTDEEQIIFVCGPRWGEARSQALIGLLQFYDLPATLLMLTGTVGPLDAVLAADTQCQAETFLLLSPAAACRTGSRQALRTVARDTDAACPTVLYEDGSVRFAGSTALQFTNRMPFARLEARWLGLSAAHLAGTDPVEAVGGTIECCLLRRKGLEAAAHARRFATKFGQEAALFAGLQERGCRVLWHPGVVVATADDSDAPAAESAVALVDTWGLRASWGETQCVS